MAAKKLGYYAGGWKASKTGTYMDCFDPSTGEVIAQAPQCTPAEVEEAVLAARTAFPAWADTPPNKRVQVPSSKNHYDDFFGAMRTRQRTIADAETAHRTTTVCNLGQIAMALGRKLRWDPVKEEFLGDEMANRLRSRPMRAPWSLVADLA